MTTNVSNVPTNLEIKDFLSRVNLLGGLAKSCRFAVRFNIRSTTNINLLNALPYRDRLSNLLYVCDAVEFPGRGFETSQIRYYGPSQTLPNNSEYGPCNLSFLCSNSGFERQFFDDWQEIINPSQTFNFNYPDQYFCDVEIFQFSEYAIGAGSFPPGTKLDYTQMSLVKTPQIVYNWKLYKCWPVQVMAQQATWADNSDVLRLQVSLSYKYWDRPGNNIYIVEDQPEVVQNPAAQVLNLASAGD